MQNPLTAQGGARPSRVATYGASPPLRALAAAIVLALGCAIVFSSIIGHPNSRVLSEFSDAALAMRAYDIIDQAGSTPFTFTHDDLNGAPEGSPMLPSTQIAAPIQPAFVWVFKDTMGVVGAVNAFLLSGLLLTGIAMFLLLERCRFGFLPSLFGGLVVTLNPWMVERAVSGHVAFAHGWVLVLLLFTLLRVREQRTIPRAAVAGTALGLCFLMASYSGLLAATIVAGFAIVDLAKAESRLDRLWTCTLLTAIGAVTAIFLLPGAIALATGKDRVGNSLSRSSEELERGGASLLHYLLPSPRHPLVGSFSDRFRPWDFFNEKTVFFGYTTLVLAGVAAIALLRERRRRMQDPLERPRRELAWLALAITPIALVASLGRTITIAGVDIPMPAYFIGEVIPFYRVYARLGFVVAIGVAILAALTLTRLAKRRHGNLIVAALISLIAFELAPARIGAAPIGNAPIYDQWLALQPSGVVAHYPMMTDQRPAEKLAARELYFQRFTKLPLFEIYGPQRRGTREDAIRLLARYLTNRDTPRILAAEGVRYVVVHDDVYRTQGETPPSAPPELTLLRRFGPVRVFSLEAEPIELDQVLAKGTDEIASLWGLEPLEVRVTNAGFYDGERYLDYQGEWRWMSQAGRLIVTNDEGSPATVRIEGFAFANGEPRQIELVDERGRTRATTSVPGYLTQLRLGPIEIPPGTSRLSLRSSPGPAPFGGEDPRSGSIFVSPLRAAQLPDLSRSLRKQ